MVKRSRIEVVIPVLQTSRVSNKHTSLEEIRDIEHFVDRLDTIELPNQIISTLGDAMAQKYLHLVQSEAANDRLDEWLKGFLADKLEQIHEDDEDEPEILSFVLGFLEGYTSFTKVNTSILRYSHYHLNSDNTTGAFTICSSFPRVISLGMEWPGQPRASPPTPSVSSN
jgi:centromere protein I